MAILESLISAGSSLLGGLFGKSSAEKQQERNEALQREFAQSGIQWKVEDAKKAGVHPLYALGASTHSFTPQTIGDPLAGAIPEAGNAIARGVHSTMSGSERFASKAMEGLALERAQLQNDQLKLDILASRNKLLSQAGTAKPVPTDTMVVNDSVDNQPRTAMVSPPSPDVETVKLFGLPLQRNPRLFSSGQTAQDEFGEPGEWITGLPAMWEAFTRAWGARASRAREEFERRTGTRSPYYR